MACQSFLFNEPERLENAMKWQSKSNEAVQTTFWRSNAWLRGLAPVVIICMCGSVGVAQCNRGGNSNSGGFSGGPASQFASAYGGVSAVPFGNSFGSPLASVLASQQMQSQMARQQILARQYVLRQQMARQQRARERVRQNSALDRRAVASRSSLRNQRIRRQNAEKLYANAGKAARDGNTKKAEEQYRRVLRILGPTSALGEKAKMAIASLNDASVLDDEGSRSLESPEVDSPASKTMLTSLTTR